MKYISFFLLSLLLCSCNTSPVEQTVVGEALGTTYQIKYYSSEDIELEKALDSIFERVNQSMSTYREDSDISRLNRGEAVVVDTLFQRVFLLSRQVYEQSEGYFDPTVGNLVNLYGFGPEKDMVAVDSATVDSLMQFVGLDKIRISEEGKVEKEVEGIFLDFNAIAKGYAIDLVGHYLDSKDIENYLIELGGELLARGKNLDRQAPWMVGIDDPGQEEGERTLTAAVVLINRAMATSGNYRKNRIDKETGKLFVHTVDPLTGYAQKNDLLSASVLAENCALADAYATAFMAMGFERSKELLEDLEAVDAFLIYAGEEGKVEEFSTDGFKEVLREI